MAQYKCPKCGYIKVGRANWTRTINCPSCKTSYNSDENKIRPERKTL